MSQGNGRTRGNGAGNGNGARAPALRRFARREDLGLGAREFATLERLGSPMRIQAFVNAIPINHEIGGETVLSVGEGNGPVNALDKALRKDLGPYQSFINDLELVDYKVRILTGGTDAVTRVLIESRDGVGNRWFTIGVSPNIVDASFEALLDSINYKLIRDGAPAP